MTHEDACNILGIPHDANLKTARAAYRRLAKQHHPDANPLTGGNPHLFRLAVDAWECVQKTIIERQAQEEERRKREEEEKQRKAEEEQRKRQEEEQRKQQEEERKRRERERAEEEIRKRAQEKQRQEAEEEERRRKEEKKIKDAFSLLEITPETSWDDANKRYTFLASEFKDKHTHAQILEDAWRIISETPKYKRAREEQQRHKASDEGKRVTKEYGKPRKTLTAHVDGVHCVAFSPDGRTLASGSPKTIILWDAQTGVRCLEKEIRAYSVAFSPDGRTLAIGGILNIQLWDVQAGAHLRTLTGHTFAVSSMAYSPDGRTIASGSYDRTSVYGMRKQGRFFERSQDIGD